MLRQNTPGIEEIHGYDMMASLCTGLKPAEKLQKKESLDQFLIGIHDQSRSFPMENLNNTLYFFHIHNRTR